MKKAINGSKIYLAAALAIALLIGGCGGGSDIGAVAPTQAPTQADLQSDSDKSEIDEEDIAVSGDWKTKDYTNTVVKWVDRETTRFNTNKANWGYALFMAIQEWEELHGAVVDLLPGLDQQQVTAGLVAGEGYDLIRTGKYFLAKEMLEPFAQDEIDHFTMLLGHQAFGLQGFSRFKGGYYGVLPPWENAATAICYNADLLTRLGVERPAQLFMRGEWTWDAYYGLAQHVGQLDLDGDGKPEYVATMNGTAFNYLVRVFEENDDGTYEVIADSQRLRDLADMIYNGYNILDIYTEEMPSPWTNYAYSGERYPFMIACGIPAYDPTCFFGFTDGDGEALEWVPMPVYGDGREFSIKTNAVSIMKGAQNRDGALNLLDYVFNCVGDSAMQKVTRGLRDYGYKGLAGSVPDSADFVEYWENFVDTEWQKIERSPYYDWTYYEACLDYWDTLPVYGGRHYRYDDFDPPDYRIFMNEPPATAIATYVESLRVIIENYNDQVRG